VFRRGLVVHLVDRDAGVVDGVGHDLRLPVLLLEGEGDALGGADGRHRGVGQRLAQGVPHAQEGRELVRLGPHARLRLVADPGAAAGGVAQLLGDHLDHDGVRELLARRSLGRVAHDRLLGLLGRRGPGPVEEVRELPVARVVVEGPLDGPAVDQGADRALGDLGGVQDPSHLLLGVLRTEDLLEVPDVVADARRRHRGERPAEALDRVDVHGLPGRVAPAPGPLQACRGWTSGPGASSRNLARSAPGVSPRAPAAAPSPRRRPRGRRGAPPLPGRRRARRRAPAGRGWR
jgi:hypothetical protein